MAFQRQYSLVGNDDISLLCSGFIKFVEELLLPIAKQDTRQFQSWTKFKEMIDPFNKKVDIFRIDQFLINQTKGNQENKPPISFQVKDIKHDIQDSPLYVKEALTPLNKRESSSFKDNQTEVVVDMNDKFKSILEKITRTFHNNNTHLDILLKMNESTKPPLQHTNSFRRIDYKRRNTELYSVRPVSTFNS